MKDDRDFVPVELSPLQVKVEDCFSFDDAMRKFRMMVQKDGILLKLKEKETYEKPSVKKRRKRREAQRRLLMEELKEKQILSGEWDKKMLEKEKKRQQKNMENHEETK